MHNTCWVRWVCVAFPVTRKRLPKLDAPNLRQSIFLFWKVVVCSYCLHKYSSRFLLTVSTTSSFLKVTAMVDLRLERFSMSVMSSEFQSRTVLIIM